MRSEGFSFYICGPGGWPVFAWPCFWCPQPFATVRNRPQPSATVCNRPSAAVVASKLPCLWEKSQKHVFFDGSEDVVISFCGRRGTLWHSTCVRCKTVIRLKLPSMGESQKRVFFDVSEDVVMSFCAAGVALCEIPRVWGARLSWG